MSAAANESHNLSSRRQFGRNVTGLTALGAATVATPSIAVAQTLPSERIRRGSTILFQGDSITDTQRNREQAARPNKQAPLGNGYAWLAAASMLVDRPNEGLRIFNRGVSGNKVFQLNDRWQKDCLDLKPDVLSILIGVNDFWHRVKGTYDGTLEVYERDYHALVKRTQDALPAVRLVICEPFALRCGAVNDEWFPAFDGYRAAARRVSDAAGATFVPFQSLFDRAVAFAPTKHWARDGVHPTAAGAALMANAWLQAVLG